MNEAGLCDPCTTAVQTTVRGAMLFSLGQVPGGTISPSAVAWAQEILPGMFMSKLKYGLVLALVVGVLGGGAGLAMLQEVPPPQTSAEPAKTAGPKPEEEPVNQQDDPLPAGAVARLGTLRFRHSDSISGIAIGPDCTSILSSTRNAVHVWDLATGKERKRLAKDKTGISSFAITRDGKILATGSYDGTIHLWDTDTGRELLHFTAHTNKAAEGRIGPAGAFVMDFTPDGRHNATGSVFHA
jgi:hypothetical protein